RRIYPCAELPGNRSGVLGARSRCHLRIRYRFLWRHCGLHFEWKDRQASHRAHESRQAVGGVAGKWASEADIHGDYRCGGELLRAVTSNPNAEIRNPKSPFDLVIVGAGPAGLAAAIEAKRHQLDCIVLEKGSITNSILHFPTQMIFFTTPELLEIGGMPLVSDREKPTRNEGLKYYRKVVAAYQLDVHQYEEVVRIEQLESHVFRIHTTESAYDARNIVISIGYYDNPNLMGIPGEDLPHVSHYYTEAHPFF